MKKKILLLAIFTFLLIGCSMSNTPTSKVEELLSKYQRLDNDISMGMNSVLDEQNLTDVHKERYRKLLEDQYKNLSYEIKDEIIDGDTAMVIVEIEVIDYKKAISYIKAVLNGYSNSKVIDNITDIERRGRYTH